MTFKEEKTKNQPKIDKHKMNLKDSLICLSYDESKGIALNVCENLTFSLETIIEGCGDIEKFQATSLLESVKNAQIEILKN